MKVRTKFQLAETTEGLETCALKFEAVVSGSPENDQFFRWTPCGTLTMDTIRKDIAKSLVIGAEYYLDLTQVESEASDE